MIKKISTAFPLTALAAALLLAGCGGGGGGSASTPDGPPVASAPTVTITGAASKGTVKNARVNLYAIGSDGTKGPVVASTVTGGDGTFTAQVPASVVLLSIEVDGSAGGTFTDEISGQDLPIPVDFKIRNIAHLGTPGVTSHYSSVTPFTEMIAKTAESIAGGINAANVDAARTGFTAAFGFDAESVKPIDSSKDAAGTASDDEKQQGLLLTAVAKLASDGKLGCTAAAANDRIVCVVKAIGRIGTVDSTGNLRLDDGLRKEVRQSLDDVIADTRLNHTGKKTSAGTASFAQSVLPVQAGGVSGIQGAKNLFASLRNNSNSLDFANKSSALNSQVAGLQADFRAAVAPVDKNLINWARLFAAGIDQYNQYKSGASTTAVQTVYAVDGNPIGSCAVQSDTVNNVVATSAANAVGVGCSIPATFVRSSYRTTTSGSTYQYVTNGLSILPGVDANTYTYRARARLDSYSYANNTTTRTGDTTLGNYGADDRATGTVVYTRDASGLTHFTVNGLMPARYDMNGVALTDNEQWSATVDRKDQGNGLFEYAFSGDITSIKGGVAVAAVHVNPGSIAHIQEKAHLAALEGVRDVMLDVVAKAGASKVTGKLTIGNLQSDLSGTDHEFATASFEGSIASSAGELFKGKLALTHDGLAQFDATKPESATNFAGETVAFEGAITLPNRPAIALMVNLAKLTPTSQYLKAQYQDGNEVVQLAVSDTNIGVAPRDFAVKTADGVAFTFKSGASSVNVTKSDEVVAVIDLSSGKVNYKDGAFESLK